MVERDASISTKLIAQRYAKLLQAEIGISELYLYGSHAKGTGNQDSDIDIAVVSAQFTGDIVDDMVKLMKLRRSIDTRIEPHPFLPEDFTPANPMAKEVMQTGIKII